MKKIMWFLVVYCCIWFCFWRTLTPVDTPKVQNIYTVLDAYQERTGMLDDDMYLALVWFQEMIQTSATFSSRDRDKKTEIHELLTKVLFMFRQEKYINVFSNVDEFEVLPWWWYDVVATVTRQPLKQSIYIIPSSRVLWERFSLDEYLWVDNTLETFGSAIRPLFHETTTDNETVYVEHIALEWGPWIFTPIAYDVQTFQEVETTLPTDEFFNHSYIWWYTPITRNWDQWIFFWRSYVSDYWLWDSQESRERYNHMLLYEERLSNNSYIIDYPTLKVKRHTFDMHEESGLISYNAWDWWWMLSSFSVEVNDEWVFVDRFRIDSPWEEKEIYDTEQIYPEQYFR